MKALLILFAIVLTPVFVMYITREVEFIRTGCIQLFELFHAIMLRTISAVIGIIPIAVVVYLVVYLVENQ